MVELKSHKTFLEVIKIPLGEGVAGQALDPFNQFYGFFLLRAVKFKSRAYFIAKKCHNPGQVVHKPSQVGVQLSFFQSILFFGQITVKSSEDSLEASLKVGK